MHCTLTVRPLITFPVQDKAMIVLAQMFHGDFLILAAQTNIIIYTLHICIYSA